MFAPWVGRIFVVVASPSQVPAWLNASHERIRIIYHEQIFDRASTQLPTFNSLAIETVLHRIDGLSNLFMYFNNDVFLGRPLDLSVMITPTIYKRYQQNWQTTVSHSNPICEQALTLTADGMPKAPLPSLQSRRANDCDKNNQFFWNRALAAYHWNVPLEYWFAHIPHLWERRILYEIEETLADPIATCRRNKWRDPDTDVSMNIQYESWLLAESNKRTPTERIVVDLPIDFPDSQTGKPRYMYSYLPAPDVRLPLEFAIYKPQLDAEYRNLDRMLGEQAQFIALEDDLTALDDKVREYHRSRLESLMAKHWPNVAPWEIL